LQISNRDSDKEEKLRTAPLKKISHENAKGRSNNMNCPLLLWFSVGQILIQVRLPVSKLNQLKTDGRRREREKMFMS